MMKLSKRIEELLEKHDFSVFAFYRVIIAIIIYVKLIWFS